MSEHGERVADGRKVWQRRGIDEHDLGFGIVQAVFQRVGAEQERKRHRDRAHLIARDVRDGRFGPLRQDDRDLVAAPHTQRREGVRQPVRLLLKVPEGECGGRAPLVLPIHREAGAIRRVAAADCVGDVELGRHFPSMPSENVLVAVRQHRTAFRQQSPMEREIVTWMGTGMSGSSCCRESRGGPR